MVVFKSRDFVIFFECIFLYNQADDKPSRVGDLSLSISWFVCEFFSVGEFLSPSCYSVSCLSVSCRVTNVATPGREKSTQTRLET